MTLEQQYNYLIDYGIVSQEAIDLVVDINGYSIEVINDILYALTAYRDIEQYLEYEDKETYYQYFKGSDE